jgi:hypothetical protein
MAPIKNINKMYANVAIITAVIDSLISSDSKRSRGQGQKNSIGAKALSCPEATNRADENEAIMA